MDIQLEPEELLLAQLVRVAIRDARQTKNERVREEAAQCGCSSRIYTKN